MKELVKFSEHIYCLQLSTNIGILVSKNKNGEDELHLIDSGNSEDDAKKILSVLKEHFPSGKLKTIINTMKMSYSKNSLNDQLFGLTW